MVAGAVGGFALGAVWGTASPGPGDTRPLRGGRGADAAVLGLGLGAWLGPKALGLGSAEGAAGGSSDREGGRKALPGIDRWFRERLAGHSSLGTRRDAARWADLTLAAALAQPFGVAAGADPPQVERDLLVAAGTLGVTVAVAGAVKKVFNRPRPYAHYCEPLWPDALCKRDAHYSFPSGHATASFAAAFLSARLAEMHDLRSRGRVWATGLTLASATAFFQMRADKHYFTDVAAGAGAGALLGWFLPALHRPNASASAAASSAPAPAAISLALPPPRGSGVVLVHARYAQGVAVDIAWMW